MERLLLVFAVARRLLTLAFRRGRRDRSDDAADMGTAFGLDVSTFFEPETPEEIAAREPLPALSRFDHRLHRRSTF